MNVLLESIGCDKFNVVIDNETYPQVTLKKAASGQIHVFHGEHSQVLQIKQSSHATAAQVESGSDLVTPMPCKISSIPVKVGDRVTKGTVVAILEAMKMEHVLKASHDGVVKNIFFSEGAVVGEKQRLIELEI